MNTIINNNLPFLKKMQLAMDKTIITLLASAFVIAVLGVRCSNAICSQQSFPSTFDLRALLPSVGQLLHPSDILVTSYRFTCEGTITHWEAYTTGTGSHPMEFQVWREAPELLRYNLVGNNIFPTASPTNGMLRLGVPVDQQITVMPGDFVGVRTIQGNEDDPFQILTILGYYLNYNLTDRGFDSTPAQLPLGSLFGLDCFTPSNSLPTNISITPLINAVLNSTSDVWTPEPSNSDPSTPPPDEPATSQALLIATGVLAGLLLTLLIILVVTVTLFCCYMQHKRGGNTVKEPAMTSNTAYNGVRGGEVELTSNTAYNHARGDEVELTPNDAYNDQTGDTPYYSRITT